MKTELKPQPRYLEKVRETLQQTKHLKDARIRKINFTIGNMEFYQVEYPDFPDGKGIIYAVDDNAIISSARENAFPYLLQYLEAGKEKGVLSAGKFVQLYRLFTLDIHSGIINEKNIRYYREFQKESNNALSVPGKTLHEAGITYSFWVYHLPAKQVDFYECTINDASELSLKINNKKTEQ